MSIANDTKKAVKILVMAGGTGGHVFPALAVANELIERGVDIEWLGTEKGIESNVVRSAGITLNTIDIVGLRGKSVTVWLKMPFLLMRAVFQSLNVVKRFSPDLVLGFGGFASGPGALAARIFNIPIVIHEQNAIVGTTNKWLSKLTSHKLAAFPDSLNGAEVVGNPIRSEITSIASPEERLLSEEKKSGCNLLVLGGSLGAKKLNEIVPASLALINKSDRPNVWHQTGKLSYQETVEAYGADNIEAKVDIFIDDMKEAYQWSDLVVCRSGALTVSEITAVGVAAIFVPYPHAIDDHQTVNAMWVVNNKAGLLCDEKELTAQVLSDQIMTLLSSPEKLKKLAINARALAKPTATKKVAEICLEVANG
ncbi:MAG: undecaprenyldiphospho-muramoylpentapeptide beta-N-acetylglucosaminyltransferase [Cellvibrionaceae bacterium]